MDDTKIPTHLGLRIVLESRSREEAVKKLERLGVASSCHMLVADATGGVGLEWNAHQGRKIEMDGKGRVFHSNHFIHNEMEGKDSVWLEDSRFRLERIETLCKNISKPDMGSIQALFRDEANYPGSICRKQEGRSQTETLFNIVMDLTRKEARITLGRPVSPVEQIKIRFD